MKALCINQSPRAHRPTFYAPGVPGDSNILYEPKELPIPWSHTPNLKRMLINTCRPILPRGSNNRDMMVQGPRSHCRYSVVGPSSRIFEYLPGPSGPCKSSLRWYPGHAPRSSPQVSTRHGQLGLESKHSSYVDTPFAQLSLLKGPRNLCSSL